MRNLLFALFVLFCHTGLHAQHDNKKVIDEKSGKEILLGTVTREGLISMGDWFELEYTKYQPDPLVIDSLKANRNDFPWVFIVLGTWCSDSREQVPHFLKILDMIDYPSDQIFMVAVDRDKKAGNFCIGDYNISLVPTFIFTKDGEETGRIIETPVATLERDLLKITALKSAAPEK